MTAEKPEEVIPLLACVPWHEREPTVQSERKDCTGCGRHVAVSASSRPALAVGARIVCPDCVIKIVETGDELEIRHAAQAKPEDLRG